MEITIFSFHHFYEDIVHLKISPENYLDQNNFFFCEAEEIFIWEAGS